MEEKDPVKKTSMRLRASTQAALKAVVAKEGLNSNDAALRLLLETAGLGEAANRVPHRKQTLEDVQELIRRLIAKFEDNFDQIADTIDEAERKTAEIETRLNAIIKDLQDILKERDALIETYKDALNRVGVDVKKLNAAAADEKKE